MGSLMKPCWELSVTIAPEVVAKDVVDTLDGSGDLRNFFLLFGGMGGKQTHMPVCQRVLYGQR